MSKKIRHKIKTKEDSFRPGYQPLFHGGIAVVQAGDKVQTIDEKAAKVCIICQKEHNHNNVYCSAQCCKSDKGKL